MCVRPVKGHGVSLLTRVAFGAQQSVNADAAPLLAYAPPLLAAADVAGRPLNAYYSDHSQWLVDLAARGRDGQLPLDAMMALSSTLNASAMRSLNAVVQHTRVCEEPLAAVVPPRAWSDQFACFQCLHDRAWMLLVRIARCAHDGRPCARSSPSFAAANAGFTGFGAAW